MDSFTSPTTTYHFPANQPAVVHTQPMDSSHTVLSVAPDQAKASPQGFCGPWALGLCSRPQFALPG